jgi:phosphoribosylanthranilate isomerase
MWLKICGITDPATLPAIAALRPDAIGFNFCRSSKRRISPEAAAVAIRGLTAGIEPVGVFVNHSQAEIRAICEQTGIATVQLHGDESPEFAAGLGRLPIIRVYRVGADGLSGVAQDLTQCRDLGVHIRACLVEPQVAGHYGGSGMTAPWDVIRAEWRADDWPPLLLAGGLTPENVAEAVRTVRPWGVDVASGVESAPGIKDPERVTRFISAARAAS